MRNVHLIPTDKPSRLYIGDNGNFVFGMIQTSIQSRNNDFTNQNIYITSDEEIKEGDWVIKISSLYKGGGIAQKYSFIDAQFENIIFKKIILTTDQDLIKDGVQSIDDEFLEWLVLNPTCEEVEIDKNWNYPLDKSWEYKIIIPKKNFYCGDEVDYGEQCDFQCERCVDCTGVDYGYLPKEDLGYTTKIGIKVVDGMVRPLMVPKKYFGEEKVYNNSFHYQTRWLLDFLSDKDYLTDKREVIEKEFEEYLNK